MPRHLGDLKTDARIAIVTGDPDRVPHLATALGVETATWSNRGYVCTEIEYGSTPMLVAATGIGGPSTAIVAEELAEVGVERIVRVGTCGSLQSYVRAGDLVICAGSVRDDGTSHQYLPPSFPAVPDYELLSSITAAATSMSVPYHVGVTHCKDAYYAERPAGMPLEDEWNARWRLLRAAGALATEMEAAALFAVATVRRLQAAALFVPVDSSLTGERRLAALRNAARVVGQALYTQKMGGDPACGQ